MYLSLKSTYVADTKGTFVAIASFESSDISMTASSVFLQEYMTSPDCTQQSNEDNLTSDVSWQGRQPHLILK